MKGKILGSRYKIIEYLSEGGFGRTYLAEDTQLPGRDTCLVKQLYPSRSDPNFLAIARRLFKTEAATLHSLGHHQQIPELLAYFEEEKTFYLVQQYIQGTTLTKELDQGEIWSESQVIAFLQDGLHILRFIHEQQVIHRDIKPDNFIRRESDNKLVLVDFGSVKQVLQKSQTNMGQLTVAVGTQGYMSTEQARGKPCPSSDIYAMGMIAIQALTGIVPLELPDDENEEIIWESSANVSHSLSAILTRMTRQYVSDRYQSAQDVLSSLDELPGIATKVQHVTDIQQDTASISETSQSAKFVVLPRVSDIQINQDRLAKTAIKEFNPVNVTTVNPNNSKYAAHSSVKTKKNKNIWLAIAFIGTVGLGIYLVVQQSLLELKIDHPINRELEDRPQKSNQRLKQGEGFRKDL